MGLNRGRCVAGRGWVVFRQNYSSQLFIRAGAAMVRLTVELQPGLELVRRERAGKLASWQARLRADRDFD